MKRRKRRRDYPNGGDNMFFYHKSTGHPAKQLAHTLKTWTNRRYTHSPNNLKNYILDESLSTTEDPVYYHKTIFVDTIYKRGRPYDMSQYKKKKKRWLQRSSLIAEQLSSNTRPPKRETSFSTTIKPNVIDDFKNDYVH